MLKQDYRPMSVEERKVVTTLVYGKPESVVDKFIRGFVVLVGSSLQRAVPFVCFVFIPSFRSKLGLKWLNQYRNLIS